MAASGKFRESKDKRLQELKPIGCRAFTPGLKPGLLKKLPELTQGRFAPCDFRRIALLSIGYFLGTRHRYQAWSLGHGGVCGDHTNVGDVVAFFQRRDGVEVKDDAGDGGAGLQNGLAEVVGDVA